jgi:hypothetical protein
MNMRELTVLFAEVLFETLAQIGLEKEELK